LKDPQMHLCAELCSGNQFADYDSMFCVSDCPLGKLNDFNLKECVDNCSNGTYFLKESNSCVMTCWPLGRDEQSKTCSSICPLGMIVKKEDEHCIYDFSTLTSELNSTTLSQLEDQSLIFSEEIIEEIEKKEVSKFKNFSDIQKFSEFFIYTIHSSSSFNKKYFPILSLFCMLPNHRLIGLDFSNDCKKNCWKILQSLNASTLSLEETEEAWKTLARTINSSFFYSREDNALQQKYLKEFSRPLAKNALKNSASFTMNHS